MSHFNEYDLRSDLQYSVALTLEYRVALQMSMVDVFSVGGAAESNRWEQSARNAFYLDREDFFPSGYKVSARFKAPASTPWPRGGPRPSDRSQPSPAKKRRTSVPQHAVNLADEEDDGEDPDFHLSKEEDDVDEEAGRDDVPLNMDPADEYGSPPHRPFYKCTGLQAVIGDAKFQRNSRGVILHGAEGEEEGKGPDGFNPGLADDDDGGQPTEARAADSGAERQDRERMENLRLHEGSRRIQMENSQMMQQTQQTTNMLLTAFMKMNPNLLQALPAASLSPPLIITSGASGSVLGGSST